MTVEFCKCGNQIDTSPASQAECLAVAQADFGTPDPVSLNDPDLEHVCEDCYNKWVEEQILIVLKRSVWD